MPYLAVSLKGTLGTSEVWSVNPNFAISTAPPNTITQADLVSFATAVAAVPIQADLNAVRSNAAVPSTVRCDLRDDDGTLQLSAEVAWPNTPGATSPTKGPTSAVVLSLRTDTPGPSARGRLYWPALALNLETPSLRIGTNQTNDLAQGAATYLRAIQDALEAATGDILTPELCVVSRLQGVHRRVTTIRVGNVLDTQRRRRDALREAYSEAPMYP